MIDSLVWSEIWQASYETLYMVTLSLLFSVLLGLPLGVTLVLTAKGSLLENQWLYQCLSVIVNLFRSIPFIILLVLIIPFTKWIVGTSIGVDAAIPPLVVGAAPFFARLVETALREVDRGIIEAAQAMGASTWQIIWRVLLPEARPGLIAGMTITAVSLVGYSAMAGAIGGGGLGDLAIRYGYQRFQTGVMLITTGIMVLFVQVMQTAGDKLVLKYTRK